MRKVKIHLEYIWLDGSYPQQIRSKTKIVEKELDLNPLKLGAITIESLFQSWKKNPENLPMWNFDGSSTGQAETSKSELLLKPVNIFKDPFKIKLVLLNHSQMSLKRSRQKSKSNLKINTIKFSTTFGYRML